MNYPVNDLKVGLNFGAGVQPVGRLAIRGRMIYFEYHREFIQSGLEISPFRLPMQAGVVELPPRPFDGLAGVFIDSLPDGWGKLLFDRMLKSHGILPGSISPLDRLAHVGIRGMGALTYEPDQSPTGEQGHLGLDQLALHAEQVMQGAPEEVIDELLALNGSSAGDRPKALIGVGKDFKDISHGVDGLAEGFEPWLVKFSNSHDGRDAGAIEYVYALMAKEAGA